MAYRYRTIKVDGKTKLYHRHVMELHIGRPLRRDEQVHHRNGDPWDNRLENLEALTAKEHQGHHKQKHPIKKVCEICLNEFEPHPTKRERARACSMACGRKLLWKVRRGEAPKSTVCPQVAAALVSANTREWRAAA